MDTLESGEIELMRKLWGQLTQKHKIQFFLLLILMVISSLAEVLSLGAVVPFISALTAPETLYNAEYTKPLITYLNISEPNELILPLTAVFIGAALFSGLLRITLIWTSTRTAFSCAADLSVEVYRRTLYQPYLTQVSRNSSEIISGITTKVAQAGKLILLSLMFISSLISVLFIVVALLFIDTVMAITALSLFGLSYGMIALLSRRMLLRNSKYISGEQDQVVKAIQEGLGGVRDVLLDGTQPEYCALYEKSERRLKRSLGTVMITSMSPRTVMEAVAMIFIAVIAFVFITEEDGASAVLPMLGALALGAQRMLPALQQAYSAYSSITGSGAALSHTVDLLQQPMNDKSHAPQESQRMGFNSALELKDVYFSYHNNERQVLNDLSINIPKGSKIGIVGGTGSGKSTALDVMMGLLNPTRGNLIVDGKAITEENVVPWQKCIAHVPQAIYLADSTLAENIAFGVPKSAIDMQKVRESAAMAKIAEFIENEPLGYSTLVGERGVRLSGGQRQRIGIARALYKNADVLFFDEATSALDGATENAVMETINDLSSDLTIVMIAHRLGTVRECDKIIELENGKVVGSGTFEELVKSSDSFRESVSKSL